MNTTDIQLPEPRTALYPLIQQRVVEAARPLIERLRAWRMMNAGAGLTTTDFDGRPVSYAGVSFEGSPKLRFWGNFFEPFILDAARQSLQWVIECCRERDLEPAEYLLEAKNLVGVLVTKTYEDMARTDQLLRGGGYPNSVAPVTVSPKISAMKEGVDQLLVALTHRGAAMQRDDLTQLLTRGAFDAALTEAVEEATRQKRPLSLVLGDIDHFKRVNDTHGHQAGDAVLREVASRLIDTVHGKGLACRYGGEEISIVLRNHSSDEAIALAERGRRRIEQAAINGIPVTMSFGVACLPDHASDASSLVQKADMALYDAKNHGRNLVRLSGEPAPASPGARVPDRKVPEPGRLTDRQRTDLRRRLLRHERIKCPEDGAFLDVDDVTTQDSVGRDFVIACPECGLTDHLPGSQRAG